MAKISISMSAASLRRRVHGRGGEQLFGRLLDVCSGADGAEHLGRHEFAIHRRNPTISSRGGCHVPLPVVICGLLFLAATINCVDRRVIRILKPTLQARFSWSGSATADRTAFQLAYALADGGRPGDPIGSARRFRAGAVDLGLAAVAHAVARLSDRPWPRRWRRRRRLLQLGRRLHGRPLRWSSAKRPFRVHQGIKNGFPPRARAGDGDFQFRDEHRRHRRAAGRPVAHPAVRVAGRVRGDGRSGICMAAALVAALRRTRASPFRLAGRARAHHQRSAAAGHGAVVAAAAAAPADVGVLHREVHDRSHLVGVSLLDSRFPSQALRDRSDVTRVAADSHLPVRDALGSIGGGWLSSSLLRRGWSVNAARKTAMLLCACAVLPMAFAAQARNEWTAVCLVGLAAAAHQGFSCNLFTLASDMFPREAVGSVVGFGGMWGSIGAMLIAVAVGYILQATGSYVPVFIMASVAISSRSASCTCSCHGSLHGSGMKNIHPLVFLLVATTLEVSGAR